MELIDACYVAAGLPIRQPTPVDDGATAVDDGATGPDVEARDAAESSD